MLIGGQPFTSYIWPTTLKKPVLFPIRTAKGTLVTRGFPLDPRPGERVDHPHHVGLWFNYGDVNGSISGTTPTPSPAATSTRWAPSPSRRDLGDKRRDAGELDTDSDWVAPDGTVLLKEHTNYVFRGTATTRAIDRITTLTRRSEARAR